MDYKKVPLTCDPRLVGYSIDTNGIIYSKYGRPMKPFKNSHGYLIESFNVKGKMVSFQVHRLVAKQFLVCEDQTLTVNHKNGIKTDNRVDNLEFATMDEQLIHANDVLGHNCIPRRVVVKDMKTGKVHVFKSQNSAAKILQVDRSNFYRAAKKGSTIHTFKVAPMT